MKILMINSVCGTKSTGRICTDLALELEQRGHSVKIAYGRGKVPAQYVRFGHRIGTDKDVAVHGSMARVFDTCGYGSRNATRRFIEWMKQYDPDVIHLHNLHGYYINVPLLFKYLKHANKRIIWTLHDCWPFTGHCCYFDYADCSKWHTQCTACPEKKEYPASIFQDRSKKNFIEKKQLFSGLADMTLVTPSKWLAAQVRESFLQSYPVYTIPNWVNLSSFSPTAGNAREHYSLGSKRVVLGVASVWDRRKGLDIFLQLDAQLGKEYQIVLVGLSEAQLKKLPKTIIGISHTSSVNELAELYTLADVFVNPTYEDNYPATNLEAIACGTPVVSFAAGGSGESAAMYGTVVQSRSIDALVQAIQSAAAAASGYARPNLEEHNKKAFCEYLRLIEGTADEKQ